MLLLNSIKEMYPLEYAVMMKDPKAIEDVANMFKYIQRKCQPKETESGHNKGLSNSCWQRKPLTKTKAPNEQEVHGKQKAQSSLQSQKKR